MLFILTSVLYNEIVYLEEWINFHLKQGIDKLYIYIRYHSSDINYILFNTVKEKYSENLNIIFIHLIWKPYNHMYHFFENYYEQHINDWMSIIDIDEFLYSPLENKKIPDIIEIYEKEKKYAIGVNWKCFGSNNIINNPNYEVLKKFTKCADKYNGINCVIKSLIKCEIIDTSKVISSHKQILKKGYKYYTSDGLDFIEYNKKNLTDLTKIRRKYLKQLNLPLSIDVNWIYHYPEDNPYLIINHYILRSRNEYQTKIDNNPNRKDRYNLKNFKIYNSFLNEMEDKIILDKL